MNYIDKKIEALGGVHAGKRKNNLKLRDKLVAGEKPPAAVVALIDDYGRAMFRESVEYKSATKIPIAGGKWGGIDGILGWGTDTMGVAFYLENLQDEDNAEGYFPFAEGYSGDLICIQTKGKSKGRVYYWSHDDGEFYLISKSFKAFVMSWEKEKPRKKKKGYKEPELISVWFADDL